MILNAFPICSQTSEKLKTNCWYLFGCICMQLRNCRTRQRLSFLRDQATSDCLSKSFGCRNCQVESLSVANGYDIVGQPTVHVQLWMIPVIEESFWVVVIHEGGIDVRRQNENAIHGVHPVQPWLSLSRIPSFSLPEVLAADCLQQHDGPCLYCFALL